MALLLLALGGAGACGAEDASGVQYGPTGGLELLSPASPLGLRYGERADLRARYTFGGKVRGGALIQFSTEGEPRGSTLSAGSAVTGPRGEAVVGLIAGSAEAAFHVIMRAPDAAELPLDVAVSRRSFGSMAVRLDASGLSRAAQVFALRASLYADTSCTALPPTPALPPAVRSLSLPGKSATLSFGTLLSRGYTVTGRAEDETGHLLYYGCIELPEEALVTGLYSTVEVPLSPALPAAAGTYTLSTELQADLGGLIGSPWSALSCPLGVGQALLDALIAALPVSQMPLASRLGSGRGPLDPSRCRPASMPPPGGASLDQKLHDLLAGAGKPGEKLAQAGKEMQAIQRKLVLTSELLVRAQTGLGLIADHTLLQVTFQTGAMSSSDDLGLLGLPVLSARDLVLQRVGERLDLPTQALTLRLPLLWRRALLALVLTPRGLTAPAQLVDSAVGGASWTGHSGCAAVEALLCETAGPPCVGVLLPACQGGALALGTELLAVLRDRAKGADPDLTLSGFAFTSDPDGTLKVQALERGQLLGTAALAAGTVTLEGPLSGPRTGP